MGKLAGCHEDRFGCHDGIRPSGEIDVGGRCLLGLEVGWYISCPERGWVIDVCEFCSSIGHSMYIVSVMYLLCTKSACFR